MSHVAALQMLPAEEEQSGPGVVCDTGSYPTELIFTSLYSADSLEAAI